MQWEIWSSKHTKIFFNAVPSTLFRVVLHANYMYALTRLQYCLLATMLTLSSRTTLDAMGIGAIENLPGRADGQLDVYIQYRKTLKPVRLPREDSLASTLKDTSLDVSELSLFFGEREVSLESSPSELDIHDGAIIHALDRRMGDMV